MSMISLIRKLKSIDRECDNNIELKNKLEPWVIKMNNHKPSTREEARKIAEEFIDEYEKIKNELGASYGQNKRVCKIEQINER